MERRERARRESAIADSGDGPASPSGLPMMHCSGTSRHRLLEVCEREKTEFLSLKIITFPQLPHGNR